MSGKGKLIDFKWWIFDSGIRYVVQLKLSDLPEGLQVSEVWRPDPAGEKTLLRCNMQGENTFTYIR